MKVKPLIACRPDAPLAEMFFKAVEDLGPLGINDSELARRSILEGLQIAKRKIIEEKRKVALDFLERFKDPSSSTRSTAWRLKSSAVFA